MKAGNVTKLHGDEQRQQLISVLQSSLYVGAKAESVGMVLDYCEAAKLDPMQKPVHIVPMNTKNQVTGNYEWRDVVMPGIGLYRIQADRSGTMAGMSEPEFGPDVTKEFSDKNGKSVTVTFPEWCKVTAQKLVAGTHIVNFTAKEYWLENYATDSAKSDAPNAMWRKRPKGQIAKCAEAQALRKAWPEIGSSPTAEEMEGKTIDMGPAQRVEDEPQQPKELPEYPADQFDANLPKWRELITNGRKTADDIIAMVSSRYQMTDEQMTNIRQADAESQ